ncbi:unnamed protein product [Owenia fusiformis]|uniref:MYND-type domain-containing protein n=1 Tax=Owenia fusiformis TaxID=6347 RepID=A0A8S4PYH8_OWEFU|nr:unnamed protein product [Owenia fusiformis]
MCYLIQTTTQRRKLSLHALYGKIFHLSLKPDPDLPWPEEAEGLWSPVFCQVSKNVPLDLPHGYMAIKNYGENEDIVKAVWETGFFEDTGRKFRSGYVEMPVWKLKDGVPRPDPEPIEWDKVEKEQKGMQDFLTKCNFKTVNHDPPMPLHDFMDKCAAALKPLFNTDPVINKKSMTLVFQIEEKSEKPNGSINGSPEQSNESDNVKDPIIAQTRTFDLEPFYNKLKHDTKDNTQKALDDVLEVLKTGAQTTNAEIESKLDQLVPLVQEKLWFENVKSEVQSVPGGDTFQPVNMPIDGIEHLVYTLGRNAEDGMTNIQYEKDGLLQLEMLGVSRKECFRRAIENFRKSATAENKELFTAECNGSVFQGVLPKYNASLLTMLEEIAKLKVNGGHIVQVSTSHGMLVTGSRDYSGMLMMGECAFKLLFESDLMDRLPVVPLRLVAKETGSYQWAPYVPNIDTEFCVPQSKAEAIKLGDAFMNWMGEIERNPAKKPKTILPQFLTPGTAHFLGCTDEAIKEAFEQTPDYMDKKKLQVCFQCGKTAGDDVKLLSCIKCRLASYCGKPCQKTNWKTHKVQCKIIAKTLGN